MIIVAGGDSFIWGSELADSPHGGPYGFSRSTFPALLADDYVCCAYPGIGNKEIASTMIAYINQTIDVKDIFVVVCWTWATRDNDVNSDHHIRRLQELLESKRIPYMFTCADNCIITGKLDYSKWFMFPLATESWNTTEPRGFYQWAVENKYDVGPENHPLEQAHYDAAQLMKDTINELVKTSIQ